MSTYTEAWHDGYNAALDDIRAIGETLIDKSYSDHADLLVDFIDRLISND